MIWLIITIIVIIGLAVLSAYLKLPKCPNCKKRKSKETDRKISYEEKIKIKKEEQVAHYSKNQISYGQIRFGQKNNPSSVTVRKYTVPGKRIYYDVTYHCNNCGTEYTRTETKDEECT